VIADGELERDSVVQAHERLRLRLRTRRGAAVRLARELRGGALLVIAPVLGVVPVWIDAVGVRDLPVRVVVAQVLPPEALDVERVLVAIGVVHEDEPELGVPEEAPDLAVVRPPLVDVPMQ
jgi:hypothetical protein